LLNILFCKTTQISILWFASIRIPSIRKIWPKPMLFYVGPSLNKDKIAKISIIHLCFVKIWVKSKKKKVFTNFFSIFFLLIKNDLRNFGLCFQLFIVIFEIFKAILKNKDNMAPKAKDNMAKSQLSL
jgi:hypothetical protein